MRIDPHDGRCRDCGGEMEIIEADDATMTIQCLDCGDSHLVEPDAFGDGATHYYPRFLAEQLAQRRKGDATSDGES